MADLSVVETPSPIGPGGDWAVFELGEPNWSPAWVPDLTTATATGTRPLAAAERLDIVILCDGYTAKTDFENDLGTWIGNLFQLEVFEWFRGAVRVRAVYTPSTEKASADRDSFYRVKVTDDETGISFGGWPSDSGDDNEHFRERLWDVLEALGVNEAAYPSDLDGDDPLSINDTYSHLTVAMLVQAKNDDTPSGRATSAPVGPDGRRVKIGLGNNWIHELCHAFAYLADEYIEARGVESTSENPDQPSLYNVTNKCYSDTVEGCWWTHLSPCGDFARAKGPDGPPPVVGWLWRGAYNELGVWHCEHRCLMNGTHRNYCHDPDPDLDSLDPAEDGANLRVRYRFCMWCQELVVLRFLEKTGELREAGDPDVPDAELGRAFWSRWKGTWRRRYYARFDIGAQIEAREADYAAWAPTTGDCAGSPAIWTSRLYSVQKDEGPEAGASKPLDVATLLPNL